MVRPKRTSDEGAEEIDTSAASNTASRRAVGTTDDVADASTSPEAVSDDKPSLLSGAKEYHRGPASWVKSIIAVVLSLAIIGGGGYFAYQKLTALRGADYSGQGINDVTVTIESGQSISQMGDTLVSEEVVASRNAFIRAAKKDDRSTNIQAGTYRMKTHMSAALAVALLVDTSNVVHNQYTVPEGLRNSQVLESISDTTGIALSELSSAAESSALPLPYWAQSSSEGCLFPDTYTFSDESTAEELLTTMVEHFNEVVTDVDLETRAAAAGRTPYEVLVVASIIERETSDKQYAPLVAEVIYNRLAQGMKLQSDATVAFANNVTGRVTTTDEERALESPYNTYVVDGLPPGPIANPGKDAIEAALSPSTGDNLFFVTVDLDTGETKFAADEQGHEANVKQFQSWCQAHSDRCE